MSDITDAQNLATYNAENVALPAGLDTAKSGASSVLTVVSNTPFQISTKRAADLYIDVTTAGALSVAVGPTSTPANALTGSTSKGVGMFHVNVPAGWYVNLVGTVTNYTATYVLR